MLGPPPWGSPPWAREPEGLQPHVVGPVNPGTELSPGRIRKGRQQLLKAPSLLTFTPLLQATC